MKRINRLWVKESGGKHLHRTRSGFTWTPEFDEFGEVTNYDQLQAYMAEVNMSDEAKANLVSALNEFAEKGGTAPVVRKTPWRLRFKLWTKS